tara:strand:- start:140 stop:772 length:633 start_codon:yes stop_codon:yes gene_type:complete
MDYNMVCFFNFDKCTKNTINWDKGADTYTLVGGGIELYPQNDIFEGVFATYPIKFILEYIQFKNNDTEYVTRQLKLDIPRSNLICNSEYVNDVLAFINYLEWKTTNELYREIGMFCTQIVFAYPITQIQQRLNNEENDYYVCEVDSKTNDGYITNLSLYTIEGKTLYNIEIRKKLRLCYIPINGEPETIYEFTMFIKINDGFYNVDLVIE